MPSTDLPSTQAPSPHLRSLVRHFADLRDGTHGNKASRHDKEAVFAQAAEHLAPYARQALTEVNDALLLGTGTVAGTGLFRAADGGLEAAWSLTWPEQRRARPARPCHHPGVLRPRRPPPAPSRRNGR